MKTYLDPFLVALIVTVALASVLPCRGQGAVVVDHVADAGIMLLFFLHGAKLSREAILAGLRNWPVHLAVLGSSFVLFPLLGLGIANMPFVPPLVASGMLFLTLLPSTVQSSIAFTAMAGGNIAAAVCSASLSNLLGIIITPLLVSLFMHLSGGGISAGAIETIAMQLLLPFLLGHASRRWTIGLLSRYRFVLGFVDRGAILIVVYSAFSAAVVQGLWHRLSPGMLAAIALLCAALLALVLAATWAIGRLGGFSREDAIVIQFCGSKKSLVSGVPIAGVLFPASQVGMVILPLMIFHQIQLIACAMLARRYRVRQGPDAIAG
nr:bile acid:sodium symporter family protein [Sphingomonas quercus]